MDDEALLALCRALRDGEAVDGLRARLAPPPTGSAQLAAAWLPAGEAVAVLARRAARARSQSEDAVEVAFDIASAPPATRAFDPRLSVTRGPDGVPRRFGIEVWIGESEDGEQRPLRVAGELAGAPSAAEGGLTVLRGTAYASGEPGTAIFVTVPA
jgi:hypothetical protein